MRPIGLAGLLAGLSVCLVSCAEPLDFPDWTIPVPEGSRIIEYAPVSLEERTERIEFIEDLVLGEDDTDPNQNFYRPSGVAVDASGRLFIVDMGNHRVQVFDADGSFVASLGRAGQGPGEFAEPTSATVIGDRLLVFDRENMRISMWSTEGEHLGELGVGPPLRSIRFLAGVVPASGAPAIGAETGHAVIHFSPFGGLDDQSFAIGTLGLDGRMIHEFIDLPLDRTPTLQRGRRRSYGFGNPRVTPSFAADRNGDVYIAAGDEYQLLALAADGSRRWALRVAWERSPLSDELRRAVLARVRERTPDVRESEINYIDLQPSISWLAVDGHGRLYVYPYVETTPGRYPYPEPESGPVGIVDVPVDVYSPEGEHLFSGMISRRYWQHADGDFVYGVGLHNETGEYRAVRWRLDLPFDR